MSSFPTQSVPLDDVSFRVRQPYVSAAGNRKFSGFPLGAFRGFKPQVDPFNDQRLLLNPDPVLADHVATAEVTGGYAIHVRTTATYVLDFTGHAFANFPVYAYLDVDYTAPPAVGVTAATVRSVSIKSVVVINALTAPQIAALGNRVAASNAGVVNPGAVTVVEGDILTYDGVNWVKLFPKVIRLTRVRKPSNPGPLVVADLGTLTQSSITSDTFVPTNRQEPVAYNGVAVGFMLGGSQEALNAAAATTLEVANAHQGLPVELTGTLNFTIGSPTVTGTDTRFQTPPVPLGTTEVRAGDLITAPNGSQVTVLNVIDDVTLTLTGAYGGATASIENPARTRDWNQPGEELSTRLDAEFLSPGSDGMARRLAKHARPVEGTPRPAAPLFPPGWSAAGGNSSNVSSDFADAPGVTAIPVSLGPRSKGVVVEDTQTPVLGGLAFVTDLNYNDYSDETNSYAKVFGRLTFLSLNIAGTVTFTNASPAVSGVGTTFTGGNINPGDIIKGFDGRFYTVLNVTDNFNLTLTAPYTGATGATGASVRRRFTLSFFTFSGGIGGTETAFSLAPNTGFRYWFQQIFDASDRPPYADPFLLHLRPGKAAPGMKLATVGFPGMVQLAPDNGSSIVAGLAVQASEASVSGGRLGRVFAKGGGSPTSAVPRKTIVVTGVNATVTGVDDALNDMYTITVTVSASGSPFPGFTGTGGNFGSDPQCARGDHTHTGASAPFTLAASGSGSAGAADFTFAPAFVPRLLMVTGNNGAGVVCGGIAAGTGDNPAVQAYFNQGVVTQNGINAVQGDGGGTQIVVTNFHNGQVTLHRSAGAGTYSVVAVAVGN